ncbi:MAG: hypothetical protein IKF38_00385 [Clostridia bacterium]|nr:hypothetical protein [Clostridia bacterium]
MLKKDNGITLIALVITIIVLLILAGVTIAMLSGSDSTPAKANEAAQKNDIGTAKDQIYMVAQNAQTTAYTSAYVDSASTSTAAAGTVGQAVAKAVNDAYKTEVTLGKAKIKSTATMDTTTPTKFTALTVEIKTTDYTVTGTVDLANSGVITWENTKW